MPKSWEPIRCAWSVSTPQMAAYHDTEWGVPVHDDRILFEFLILEGAQAGLSLVDHPEQARELPQSVSPLRSEKDRALHRCRRGAAACRSGYCPQPSQGRGRPSKTPRHFSQVQKEFGSFDAYIWQFVGGAPIQNRVTSMKDSPGAKQRVRCDEQGPAQSAASSSWVRPSATPSCRLSAWSTTTTCSVSVTGKFQARRRASGSDCRSQFLRICWSYGAPGEIRTPGLLIRSQSLYPAELRAHTGSE